MTDSKRSVQPQLVQTPPPYPPPPTIIYLLLSKLDSPCCTTDPVPAAWGEANKATSLVTSSDFVGSFQGSFVLLYGAPANYIILNLVILCWIFFEMLAQFHWWDDKRQPQCPWRHQPCLEDNCRDADRKTESNWHGVVRHLWASCSFFSSSLHSTIFSPLHSRNNRPFCLQLAAYRLSRYGSLTCIKSLYSICCQEKLLLQRPSLLSITGVD